MVQSKKFLICFLQHRNTNYVVTAFLHLAEALAKEPELREQCKVVIAASTRNDAELAKLKTCYGNMFDVDIFECPPLYPDKIRAVLNTYPPEHFRFFIKHDEDLFLSPDSWKKILSLAPNELADNRHLLATVNLSTGIPTWRTFAETFFDSMFLKTIDNHLSHDSIPELVWNNRYNHVLAFMHHADPWNEDAYWEAVNSEPYDYKGIHPIRLNLFYAKTINEAIIERYGDFHTSEAGTSFTSVQDRYFCNSFFIISYATYEKIFNDTTLYVDLFDEVPINRYMKKMNSDFVVLNRSLGVHIMYNSAYGQRVRHNGKKLYGNELEEAFSQSYFHLAVSKAAQKMPCAREFNYQKTPLEETLRRHIVQHTLYKKVRTKLAENKTMKAIYRKLRGN